MVILVFRILIVLFSSNLVWDWVWVWLLFWIMKLLVLRVDFLFWWIFFNWLSDKVIVLRCRFEIVIVF